MSDNKSSVLLVMDRDARDAEAFRFGLLSCTEFEMARAAADSAKAQFAVSELIEAARGVDGFYIHEDSDDEYSIARDRLRAAIGRVSSS